MRILIQIITVYWTDRWWIRIWITMIKMIMMYRELEMSRIGTRCILLAIRNRCMIILRIRSIGRLCRLVLCFRIRISRCRVWMRIFLFCFYWGWREFKWMSFLERLMMLRCMGSCRNLFASLIFMRLIRGIIGIRR